MLIPLTVHRRESGRGIILYSSAYEARPSQGHVDATCVTTTSILEPAGILSCYTQETGNRSVPKSKTNLAE